MATHKIQSDQGGLTLELRQVPKLLGKITSQWAPHAFVVSFKLETDTDLLRSKAEMALNKYKVHLVIANLLQTRKDVVYLVSPKRTTDGFSAVFEKTQAVFEKNQSNQTSHEHLSNSNVTDNEETSLLEEIRRPVEARCIEARLVEQVTLRHLAFLTAEYQTFHVQQQQLPQSPTLISSPNSSSSTDPSASGVALLQTVAALRREFAELAPSRRFPQQLRGYLHQLDTHWDTLTRPAMTRPRTLTQTEEEEEREYGKLVVNYARLVFWTGMFVSIAAAVSTLKSKR
jgi:hypothetical protein